ncbi:TPA: hypothetical protein JDL67_005119 [Salmonella enterica subsp. salamae]|nr:hypothetical protein [Salmonella enterica subsp. enterica serovar Lomalinda]ECI5319645.1 hypothetical protein [Salmonella enterica subsp. enterica serovar Lomalinda]EDV1505047.1 hypothetical protein [Salmonella enterica subsp. salamae]EEI9681177.1 hypothetical protein [Salmonella enterica]HAU3362217.1 hypothetical protein [Salmonella enterica subsp. salamae]
MKKLLFILAPLFIGGCVPTPTPRETSGAPDVFKYRPYECKIPKMEYTKNITNKREFVKALKTSSFTISADKIISGGMTDCSIQKMTTVLNAIQPAFEKIKKSTKDKDEKMALIAAYSAWRAFISSPSEQTDMNAMEKISFYENM